VNIQMHLPFPNIYFDAIARGGSVGIT